MAARVPPLALRTLAFALPSWSLMFVCTWPHPLPVLWIAPVFLACAIDAVAGPERGQPEPGSAAALHDLVLYLLAAIQVANVLGLAALVGAVGLWTWEAASAAFLVGASSAYSSIVVAHELVHRPQARFRELGRWLLSTVGYEHFATEHVRGHHRRVGTAEDPATARFGEALGPFLVRTVPGQFSSAWDLEATRLAGAPLARRWLGNRMLQGFAMAAIAAGVVVWIGGPGALAAHVAQAAFAVFLLECVNYVEHWGLVRAPGSRVRTVDSWDAESWFTFHALVGLSRHGDHHANAARPWHELRWLPEPPKMPYGYFGTVLMAIFLNGRLREVLAAELERRGLGPYAAGVTSDG